MRGTTPTREVDDGDGRQKIHNNPPEAGDDSDGKGVDGKKVDGGGDDDDDAKEAVDDGNEEEEEGVQMVEEIGDGEVPAGG